MSAIDAIVFRKQHGQAFSERQLQAFDFVFEYIDRGDQSVVDDSLTADDVIAESRKEIDVLSRIADKRFAEIERRLAELAAAPHVVRVPASTESVITEAYRENQADTVRRELETLRQQCLEYRAWLAQIPFCEPHLVAFDEKVMS